MIDRHDFVKWVRTQDTRLAPKLQAMFDFYLRARASQARTTKPENAGPLYFIVDDCYRVDFTPHGLALYTLTPHGDFAGVLQLPCLRVCSNAGASHRWRVCLAE